MEETFFNDMTRADFRKHLENGVWEVTFIKSDGTDRTMICTRQKAYHPIFPEMADETVAKPHKTPSMETLPVVDLGTDSWKSFRFDSVTNMTYVHSRSFKHPEQN